ncbi:MAG: hypothetical protein IPG79_11020 [Saprospiraceae bacterium]|nr:hypothetical protein [Saprospiraceae bacterium]
MLPAEDTNGNPVNDSDDETITADQNPSIELVKSALPTTYSTWEKKWNIPLW